MAFVPASLNFTALFVDPSMFDSRRNWRRAGFDVLDTANDNECMVAGHPSAPGYLFKKYANDNSENANENYAARLKGSCRLAEFVRREGLRHIVVPQKHLHELPSRFGKAARLLVVERLDVLGRSESKRRYGDIAEPVLRDLLVVLDEFKGLDSNIKNVPFTRDGRIAFIDLEHWDRRRDRDEVKLKQIGRYLSKRSWKLARKILDDL